MRLRYYRYTAARGVEKLKTKTAIALSAIGLVIGGGGGLASLVFNTAHAAPVPQVVYNALPSVTPDTSYPSQPFQAQQTFEFGDSIHLGGTARQLNSVTTTLVTWAPYSQWSSDARYTDSTHWTHPITLNVYSTHLNANGAPDHLLATTTQDVNIPWRPAGDPSCTPYYTGGPNGWKDVNGQCNFGYAFNATFDLSASNVVLPSDVIVSLAFNTQTWGANPIGVDGPYDSLNVAVPPSQPVTVGSDASTDAVFWNTHTCSDYTDVTSKATCSAGNYGLMQDTNWTPYGTVAFQVTATEIPQSSGRIVLPRENHHYSKTLPLKAFYDNGGLPGTPGVQWAVRAGTCAVGTNTVFGNVDGHNDTFSWNGKKFTASLDIRTTAPGQYCFVFNPTDAPGQNDVRLTQTFYIDAYVPHSEWDCWGNNWKSYVTPSFSSRQDCVQWVKAEAEGDLHLSNPNQQIRFNVQNTAKGHDRDAHQRTNTVEYWNYDYPGGLHYTAAVSCSYINPATHEARFMFQIPDGHPGLSGLYVVAYVKDVHGRHAVDLYGHAATSDLTTATQWCQTGTGFSPTMYTITHGDVEVE